MNPNAPTSPPEISGFTHQYFPAEQPSSKLIVVLHGLGDSSAGFTWMPREFNLPWLNYLLLNAPNPYMFDGYSWYDIDDPEPGVLQGRALLQQLFAELAEQGWPSEDTVLFGFSQGCMMSIDFGLRWPHPLAGVVGVSGYARLQNLEEEMHPQALKQHWLITHGMYDPLLPPEKTKAQVDKLVAAGLNIEWHEFGKDHSIDPYKEVPLLRSWIAARWPE